MTYTLYKNKKYELSAAVLKALGDLGGSATVGEVANALNLTFHAASEKLADLGAHGFVSYAFGVYSLVISGEVAHVS